MKILNSPPPRTRQNYNNVRNDYLCEWSTDKQKRVSTTKDIKIRSLSEMGRRVEMDFHQDPHPWLSNPQVGGKSQLQRPSSKSERSEPHVRTPPGSLVLWRWTRNLGSKTCGAYTGRAIGLQGPDPRQHFTCQKAHSIWPWSTERCELPAQRTFQEQLALDCLANG